MSKDTREMLEDIHFAYEQGWLDYHERGFNPELVLSLMEWRGDFSEKQEVAVENIYKGFEVERRISENT